jgi:hypothetical protein
MTQRLTLPTIALVLLALLAAPAAPTRAATPKDVDETVAKAVKYLYQVQQNGNWEIVPSPVNQDGPDVKGKQWGGLTAMATYALLAAGENPQDPRLAEAITWLLKQDTITGTYALGLRAQVWQFLPEKHPQRSQIRAAVKRDRDLLLNAMHEKPGESFGFYGYFPKQPNAYDRSNSQYAVLGMWAAEQAGAEVPTKFWEIQDQVWKKAQNQDGGWEYSGDSPSTATMTAAGVATLFITQDYLLDLKKDCQGNVFNQNIEMGIGWLDRHITQLLSGGSYYGMYGVERIGVASGRRYFGALDWYKVGSESLVKSQKPDGAWGDENDHDNARKVPNTCFALYFLTRGRAPVLMSKLEYTGTTREGKAGPWNQRPRDLANFSRWMTRNFDNKFTNWQVVNLKVEAQELHDAPILYIAGNEPLNFSDAELAKLRQFAEQGGLILGNADCGNPKFVTGFRALAKKLFPRYEFRDLEQNHLILNAQQFPASKWKRKPRVQGLSNGVRELMVIAPQEDLSKAWQTRSDKTKEEVFQLGSNLYLYSVKENLGRSKGDTYIVTDTGKGKPERSFKVARLMLGDNADPEPGGWRRLANVLKNSSLATLVVDSVKPGEGKLAGYKVAHWTGTTKVKLSPKAREEIVAFVNGGGTLLVDAAGGSADFADSATDALLEMFGGEPVRKQLTQALPATHGLYAMEGAKIESFGYRNYARRRVLGKLSAPRVGAVDVGGRPGVFFSREDLSGSLVGEPVDGIVGYDPDTATAIVRNVLVYAETGGKGFPPPPPPPPKEKDKEKDKGKDAKDAKDSKDASKK